MKLKFKLLVLFSVFIAIANAKYLTYEYARVIKPVSENGLYKLKINSGVIDRSGHFRVYEFGEKDTMEVPYVLEEYDNGTYDRSYFKYLNIIDKSYVSGKASYATLVMDSGLTYNSLYLNYSSPEFFKNVPIEGSEHNKN